LGVFLALQALFLVAPDFSPLRVSPLAEAAPGRVVAAAARAEAGGLQPAGGDAAPSSNRPGPPDAPAAPPPAVTLAFAGDVHFEDFLADRLTNEGPALLSPLAHLLGGADVAVVNLETAITDRGTPDAKEFTFRAPASALRALRAAGVDAVSMANNHALDYGPVGLADSLAASSAAGLPVLGIGTDDTSAYRPWITEVRGQRVAIVAATQVLDDAPAWTAGPGHPGLASAKTVDRLLAEVRTARAAADTVVVFLHWGVEGDSCPSADQMTLADQLVAAGADVIVGGHAHRLQGAGRKGGALVAYGLGNAVFYSWGGPSTDSGVLQVTVQGRRVLGYRWEPARLVDGVATELEGPEAQAASAAWEALRACTDLSR
jgi:poly-gamma-glutamate synthesis protein (capsule biosynthesis protein)